MSKHTPGPWSVDEPHQVWAESAGEYVAITQVEEWETLPRDQVEANARLIAAAPDLLEALKAFANEIVPNNPNDPLWVNARAAIAKAEGSA